MITLLRDIFNFVLVFSFFNDALLVEKLQVPWVLKALLVLAPLVNLPYLLSFRWTPAHKLFSLYLLVCLFSWFVNLDTPDDSFIAFNLIAANFCIVAIFSQYPIRKTVAFVWLSVLVSISYAMLRPDTISEWSFRKTGGVQDANEFATHCLIFLPLGVYISRVSGFRWFPYISFIAFFEGLLLAGSVSSILAAGVLFLLVALQKRRVVYHFLRKLGRGIIVVPLVVLLLAFGWSLVLSDDLAELPVFKQIVQVSNRVSANEGNATSRMSAWRAGYNMFIENPLVGVGPLNFKLVSKDYWETPDYHDGAAEAHNTIVKVFAETGVLGAALFCILVANLLFRGMIDSRTPNRRLLFFSYLGMLSMCLTLSLSFDKYFWLIFALAEHEDQGEVPVEVEDIGTRLIGRTLALPEPEPVTGNA